jgi:hypothetical protein
MMDVNRILQKLCKWRGVFAGWQLGTRADTDAECQAVRDHREVTMLLRAEVSALTGLLIEKGGFSAEEFRQQLAIEAVHLDKAYEEKFPGFSTSDVGVEMHLPTALQTTKGWRP